jgi:hypothetical protein
MPGPRASPASSLDRSDWREELEREMYERDLRLSREDPLETEQHLAELLQKSCISGASSSGRSLRDTSLRDSIRSIGRLRSSRDGVSKLRSSRSGSALRESLSFVDLTRLRSSHSLRSSNGNGLRDSGGILRSSHNSMRSSHNSSAYAAEKAFGRFSFDADAVVDMNTSRRYDFGGSNMCDLTIGGSLMTKDEVLPGFSSRTNRAIRKKTMSELFQTATIDADRTKENMHLQVRRKIMEVCAKIVYFLHVVSMSDFIFCGMSRCD